MVIEIENLTKLYDKKIGCKEICLSVPGGQVFGFLGPNGAGKSTLVKMLVGLIYPSSGTAKLLGKPLGNIEARKKIGFLPESFKYPEWLTANQLLDYHGSLYGMTDQQKKQRAGRVLELVGMADRSHQKIRTYSRGMQQRVGLACALLPDPDLLFLDEPTSALDPVGRKEVRDIIVTLKSEGKTVFLNSHLLSEVEIVCDSVAVIKSGKIIASGEVNKLQRKPVLEVVLGEVTSVIKAALQESGFDYTVENNTIFITIQDGQQVPYIAETLVRNGARLYQLVSRTSSLETTFLKLLEEGENQCSQ